MSKKPAPKEMPELGPEALEWARSLARSGRVLAKSCHDLTRIMSRDQMIWRFGPQLGVQLYDSCRKIEALGSVFALAASDVLATQRAMRRKRKAKV